MNLLIVGLDNPQSSDPRYALFPRPSGCAGNRLMKMMQEVDDSINERSFINIPKSNLFPCGRMPTKNKKGFLTMAATTLIMSVEGTGKRVVLLGNDVRDAIMGAKQGKRAKVGVFYPIHGSFFAFVPHPSGRNQFYNDTRRRRRVGRFLVKEMKK